MDEKEYKEALRKLMITYCCIKPYRCGKLYFAQQSDIAIKLSSVKVPYLGESYRMLIKSDIDLNITRIMRGDYVCKRQSNN